MSPNTKQGKSQLNQLNENSTFVVPTSNSNSLTPTSNSSNSVNESSLIGTFAVTPSNSGNNSICSTVDSTFSNQNNTKMLQSETNSSYLNSDSPKVESKANKRKAKRKYNFQRASIACEQCRKAKTRCNYINNGSNCFRCENLSLKCSLSAVKLEPTLSNFQKSANIKTRDEVEEKKARKKRKKMKNMLNFSSIALNNDPASTTSSSLSRSDYIDGSSSSSISSMSKTNYLSVINEKIDRLNSTLNSLLDRKNSDTVNTVQYFPFENNLVPQTFAPNNESKQLPNLTTFKAPTIPSHTVPSNTLPTDPSNNLNNPTNLPLYVPPPQPFQSSLPNVPSTILQPIIAPLARPTFPATKLYEPSQFNLQNSLNSNANANHENDNFFFLNAPYLDVTNISTNLGLPFSKEIGFDITKDTVLLSIQERYDLINRKLLDYDTCFTLIEIALVHYGKWISYVEADYKAWFDRIRITSPLLFCILILLGLRHKRVSNKTSLELDILQSIHQLLSLSIYELPQSKEFLQALVLLTNFSHSLSYKHIYFDSWWISSYGLIHFMTREMTMNLLVKSVKSPEKIHQYRIWNHFTLAHLVNCILSGRPCIIDEIRLDQCRDILDLPEANTFDASIVSQLCIILSLYNSLQFPESVEVSLKELDSTYNDWKHITDKLSFKESITSIYSFAKLMILRRYILQNLYSRKQPEFNFICRKFFDTAMEISKILNFKEDYVNSSDVLKQCGMFCVFLVLQFKQLDLFNEPNDNYLIVEFIEKFLELTSEIENRIFYYNDYLTNYGELILRMKNTIFLPPSNTVK